MVDSVSWLRRIRDIGPRPEPFTVLGTDSHLLTVERCRLTLYCGHEIEIVRPLGHEIPKDGEIYCPLCCAQYCPAEYTDEGGAA